MSVSIMTSAYCNVQLAMPRLCLGPTTPMGYLAPHRVLCPERSLWLRFGPTAPKGALGRKKGRKGEKERVRGGDGGWKRRVGRVREGEGLVSWLWFALDLCFRLLAICFLRFSLISSNSSVSSPRGFLANIRLLVHVTIS